MSLRGERYMIRTNITLTKELFIWLKKESYRRSSPEKRISSSEIIRELLSAQKYAEKVSFSKKKNIGFCANCLKIKKECTCIK